MYIDIHVQDISMDRTMPDGLDSRMMNSYDRGV